jgi:uncharacterized membrane protein YdjX (TVP38/TMEM64 family)
VKQKAKVFLKIVVVILLLVAVPLVFTKVLQLPFFIQLMETVKEYLIPFVCLLLVLKTVSIVYPPLPGGVITMGAIPFIGWELAYAVDIIGSTTGALTAYFLGKRYGKRILQWVLGEGLTNKITSLKVKEKNQIEAAFVLRVASGGMLSDGLAWGASLIGLRAVPFTIGYVSSHVITTLPIFYLVSVSTKFDSWILIAPIVGLAWLAMYKLKGKYFE